MVFGFFRGWVVRRCLAAAGGLLLGRPCPGYSSYGRAFGEREVLLGRLCQREAMANIGFIHDVMICAQADRLPGVEGDLVVPGMWTLAHRGDRGVQALCVWGFRTREEALEAGAELACLATAGSPAGEQVRAFFAAGLFEEAIALYERHRPAEHVLSVQPALLQSA